MLQEYILNIIKRIIKDQEHEHLTPNNIVYKRLMADVREDVNAILNNLYKEGKIKVSQNINKEMLISLPDL